MAINYPLAMPTTPGFRRASFRIQHNALVYRSPLTGAVQTLDRPGARWLTDLSLPPMKAAQARPWLAWMLALNGPLGSFNLADPDYARQGAPGASAPLADGAGQTGSTLDTDGWDATTTGLLLPGDYIQIGTELKLITEQVDSDALGATTISFRPALRISPADNAALEIDNPVGLFRLTGNGHGWEADHVSVFGLAFAAEEVL